MIFQEPMTSLNPYQKVGFQIDESLIIHRGLTKKEARKKTLDLLMKVKIPEPEIKFMLYLEYTLNKLFIGLKVNGF